MRAAWSAALCVLVICVLAVQWEQYQTLREIAKHMTIQPTIDLVETYVSGGNVITVTTTRSEGETKAHWERRHLDDIQASWQQYPPDG